MCNDIMYHIVDKLPPFVASLTLLTAGHCKGCKLKQTDATSLSFQELAPKLTKPVTTSKPNKPHKKPTNSPITWITSPLGKL